MKAASPPETGDRAVDYRPGCRPASCAAWPMTSATTLGWVMKTEWLAVTLVTLAFKRLAQRRYAARSVKVDANWSKRSGE